MLDLNRETSITDLFSEAIETRIHSLVVAIEDVEEYKEANGSFIKCLKEIRKYLPEDKKHLTVTLDNFLSNILTVCENYYYKNGFFDAVKLQDLIKDRQNINSL